MPDSKPPTPANGLTEADLNKSIEELDKMVDKPGTGIYSSFDKLVADKAAPTTPAIDDIDQIIFRLVADIDDHMEFAGTVFKSKERAVEQINQSVAKAKTALNKAYAEEMLGLPIIQDEKEITHADPTDPNSVKEIYTIHIRNKVKAELRQAIKDKWLAGDE